MRYIRWNQEIVDATLEEFKGFEGPKCPNSLWGFAAENLVKSYYKLPLTTCTKPDDGYDMVLKDMKVDIKSDVCKDEYFSNPRTMYVIIYKRKLVADYYLFTKIDPDKHSIALIGYLTIAEIALKGAYYRKGEYIPAFKRYSVEDCYLVSQGDLHRIN